MKFTTISKIPKHEPNVNYSLSFYTLHHHWPFQWLVCCGTPQICSAV